MASVIHDLPLKVLTLIFQHLPLSDRKNIRLTCKRWYESCNDPVIIEKEKFVFDCHPCSLFMMQTLIDSYYQYFNIECICLPQTLNILFEKCGLKILSLKLYQCELYCDELKSLLINCKQMKHLCLDNCKLYFDPDLFDTLLNKNFHRKNLVSLDIRQCKITNYIFKFFCTIYPNIENLTIHSSKLDYMDNFEAMDSNSLFTYKSVLDKISSFVDRIQCLDLDLVNCKLNKNWMLQLTHVSNLRLKQFSIRNSSTVTEFSFIKFISQQTHLNYFKTVYCPWLTTLDVKTLFSTCRYLNTILIKKNCHESFVFNLTTLNNLLSLPLKILQIDNSIELFNISLEENIHDFSNHSLRYLDVRKLSPCNLFYIFKLFPKVQTNYFEGSMTDKALQKICEYQPNLREFWLISALITDYGFTGKCNNQGNNTNETKIMKSGSISFSIRRLKDLEWLMIFFCKITDVGIQEIRFTNLKYLSIVDCPCITDAGLSTLYKNNPNLEYLHLDRIKISFKSLFLNICCLHKLHTLSLEGEEYCVSYLIVTKYIQDVPDKADKFRVQGLIYDLEINKEIRKLILNCNRSLRVFQYNVHLYPDTKEFRYDIRTKQWIKQKNCQPYHTRNFVYAQMYKNDTM